VYIEQVRGNLKIWLSLFGIVIGSLPTGRVEGVVPDPKLGQYQAIPERNVFGLRPPTSDPLPTNPPAQLPKITLTGITTILGNKRALLMLAPPNLKPGDTNKEMSMILTEGERQGDVEVLQIDEKQWRVKVNNSGTVMTLTFEKDGPKLPPTQPARATAPPLPLPVGIPVSTGATTSPYLPRARGGQRTMPNRTVPGLPNPSTGQSAASGASAPVGGIPTPTGLVASPPLTPTNASNPEQDLTPEEQAIVSELQRQANTTIPTFAPPASAAAPSGQQPAEGSASAGANLPTVPGTSTLVPQ